MHRLFFILIMIVISCKNDRVKPAPENKPAAREKQEATTTAPADSAAMAPRVITAFTPELAAGEYLFRSPLGNSFRMRVSDEVDSAMIAAAADAENPACNSERFDGSNRAGVKTTPSAARMERNVNPRDLYTTLMTGESAICHGTTFLPNRRASIENRNVEFREVYLYTYKRAGDEDYHLIIGTTANVRTAFFFNVEVSGHSPAGTRGRQSLVTTRKRFEGYFGIEGCRTSYYKNDFRQDPIPVRIAGSLFFDEEHCSHYGHNGPQNWPEVRLRSAWEIHPVTEIEFLR